jgi:hypothetical protein
MTSKPPRMAIQHNMLSTHIVCIAIHLLITDTFSTPTGDYTQNQSLPI